METICQQCGDQGFENALVYCVKCLNFAVHCYCLPELPENFDEFVRWFCEDCEPKPTPQCPLEKPSPNLLTKWVPVIPEGVRGTHSRNRLKNKDVASRPAKTKEYEPPSRHSRKPREAQTKLEPAELVTDCSLPIIKLKTIKKTAHSVPEAKDQRHHSSPSERPSVSHENLDLTERALLTGNLSPLKIKLRRKRKDVEPSEAETEERKCKSSLSQQPHEVHTEHTLCVGDSSPLNECNKLGEGANSVGIANSWKVIEEISNFPEQSFHLRAQPIIDPIWRGSFNICDRDYGLLDGVVAHLSSKACPKVCEEAGFFPASICLEMLPKTALWPKSFQRAEPSGDNIALYFFPRQNRHKKSFYHLVDDIMHQELALRATVKNAELLVFSSTELPLLYWRFQGKYFLWGVFRGKQAASSHPANHHSNIESVVNSYAANNVEGGEKSNLKKTKTWDTQSPLSPLSNSCSSGGA